MVGVPVCACVRLIVLVVVLTEVCSAFLNGAIVNRLRGGAKGDNVISGKVAYYDNHVSR